MNKMLIGLMGILMAAILGVQSLAALAETCCQKAEREGKACEHQCCVKAASTNMICKSCNPEAVQFEPLFDGKSFEGWTFENGKPVDKGWEVKDGQIHRIGGGGSIYTAREYGDFELQLEWMVKAGGNSGIKYRVAKYGNQFLGPEYQILDDSKHSDGKNPITSTGSIYALKEPAADKVVKPAGQYNHTRIIVKGSKIEHWLNGKKVAEADTSTEDWKMRVARSKFKKIENFGQLRKGRIMLQEHGDEVWFRNVTIRPIKE